LATGVKISVREFVNWSFAEAGITLRWEGSGIDEKGIDAASGEVLVQIDPQYFRPAEVDLLVGDATKARTVLGWTPTSTVEELCREMVQSDMKRFERDRYLLEGGHKVSHFHE
jgi:GDPmannose 4,6-dehydratase